MMDGHATKAELVAMSIRLGRPVTARLVTDWVSLGLLDRPVRHGLGRGGGSEAYWPENQVRLFERLLRQQTTAHRVKTLCNLPVWQWLAWGDAYVPLRQTRRAMATWATGSATTPWAHARAAGRAAAEALPPSVTPKARRQVTQLLVEALERGTLDEARLTQTLERFDEADDHLRALRARYAALAALARVSDDTYLEARAFYRSLKPPMRSGDPDLQERAAGACLDLLTILGLELREARQAT